MVGRREQVGGLEARGQELPRLRALLADAPNLLRGSTGKVGLEQLCVASNRMINVVRAGSKGSGRVPV